MNNDMMAISSSQFEYTRKLEENYKTRIEELSFEPVKELQHAKIDHVLTNSFGFGGNDSSLVLSKYM